MTSVNLQTDQGKQMKGKNRGTGRKPQVVKTRSVNQNPPGFSCYGNRFCLNLVSFVASQTEVTQGS